MSWDRVRGHDEIVQAFRRAATRRRLAHAYAFVGPEGVGKFTFARTLANCLVCSQFDDATLEACGECGDCRQARAGDHPDVLRVGCPPGKKFIPIELIVGADDRRGREGLCHDLALRPMSARRRVAIVDEAHLLNEASGNALLKTLEEPPRDSLMILVAEDFDALLPTIRSRCQPVRFDRLADDDVLELLLRQGDVEDEEAAREAVRMASGSVAVAMRLLEPGIRDLRAAVHDGLAAPAEDPQTLAERLVAGVEGLGGDRQRQRVAAVWVVRFAIEFHRAVLRGLLRRPTSARSAGEPVERLTATFEGVDDAVEFVGVLIERSDEAIRQLERNSPIPLVLEALVDDLATRSRRAVESNGGERGGRASQAVRPVH